MLPMLFAPRDGMLIERRFDPVQPKAIWHDVWREAATAAVRYWETVSVSPVSDEMKEIAGRCGSAVVELVERSPV